jgi:DNA/RNA-binding domain of Phe-tRNA-synthetase-like protein
MLPLLAKANRMLHERRQALEAEAERLRAENVNALEMIDEWRGLYLDTDPKPPPANAPPEE